MAKVTIGRLELEVPDASLWHAERAAEIEARPATDGEKAADRIVELILLLTLEANPGLTPDRIKKELPFRAVRKDAVLANALRDVYVAAGIVDPEAPPGEAPRP